MQWQMYRNISRDRIVPSECHLKGALREKSRACRKKVTCRRVTCMLELRSLEIS